jgi:hypothetical protein
MMQSVKRQFPKKLKDEMKRWPIATYSLSPSLWGMFSIEQLPIESNRKIAQAVAEDATQRQEIRFTKPLADAL